jgi:AraC-like DNA-binding protein
MSRRARRRSHAQSLPGLPASRLAAPARRARHPPAAARDAVQGRLSLSGGLRRRSPPCALMRVTSTLPDGPLDRSLLTLEDVARARLEPASRDDLVGVVSAHIRAQALAGTVAIDSTAWALDTSTRSLQRALHRNGADFRTLANVIRARRARELLAGTGASITEIVAELGYSAPANSHEPSARPRASRPRRSARGSWGRGPNDHKGELYDISNAWGAPQRSAPFG